MQYRVNVNWSASVMESRDLVSVSRLVSRPIFACLGLEGFKPRLGLEVFRSRDIEYCKEMVFWNFYNSTIFCLLYFQVRNNQKTSENARNVKIFYSEVITTFFRKKRQNAKILKAGVSDSVSKFKSRLSEFLMKSRSRSRLEISTMSRFRKSRSGLHHW